MTTCEYIDCNRFSLFLFYFLSCRYFFSFCPWPITCTKTNCVHLRIPFHCMYYVGPFPRNGIAYHRNKGASHSLKPNPALSSSHQWHTRSLQQFAHLRESSIRKRPVTGSVRYDLEKTKAHLCLDKNHGEASYCVKRQFNAPEKVYAPYIHIFPCQLLQISLLS